MSSAEDPSATARTGADRGGTAAEIERLLQQRLQPEHLELNDESAAHVGHRGAGGKGHFRLRIVSTRFAGLTALQRHRLVYDILAPLWDKELHAVSVAAFTPAEFVE